MKLWRFGLSEFQDNEEFCFHCPGCGWDHSFVVKWGDIRSRGRKDLPTWNCDGNMEMPTFTPSLIYSVPDNTTPRDESGKPQGLKTKCHLFLTKGMIQFLSDCDHALKGQTVPLPDVTPRFMRP